jgi:mRNA-degrading endonuclease RelE of RelBE toxin-antitoxin system
LTDRSQYANIAVMEIEIVRSAEKVLLGMQAAKAVDIREAIARVAADPSAPHNNLRPLQGVPHGFRIRVGDWRVSYTFDPRAQKIRVFEIAPRGGAYR